jgi:hypothetical protein
MAKNEEYGVVYIGRTSLSLNIRKGKHKRAVKFNYKGYPMEKMIKDHGIDFFEWVVLEEIDDYDIAKQRELFWINQYENEKKYQILNVIGTAKFKEKMIDVNLKRAKGEYRNTDASNLIKWCKDNKEAQKVYEQTPEYRKLVSDGMRKRKMRGLPIGRPKGSLNYKNVNRICDD